MSNDLERYLERGIDEVHGWLSHYSARFISDLILCQKRKGVTGAFGEIGVHHGKLFILLQLATEDSWGFAIDIFEDQHLNIDKSGMGDRKRFENNLSKWAPNHPKITMFQRSSLDVLPEEILESVGECQFVSIDGCHTAECTLSDLKLGEKILLPEGIIAVDDCFNEQWPGVATGVAKYCLDESTLLRPFAISPNKVYLARPDQHAVILSNIKSHHKIHLAREGFMYGSNVSIFHPNIASDPPSIEIMDEMLRYAKAYPTRLVKHAIRRIPFKKLKHVLTRE